MRSSSSFLVRDFGEIALWARHQNKNIKENLDQYVRRKISNLIGETLVTCGARH